MNMEFDELIEISITGKNPRIEQVKAKKIDIPELPGYEFYVHPCKHNNELYTVTEKTTGASAFDEPSPDSAIEAFKDSIKKLGVRKIIQGIKKTLKRSALYKQQHTYKEATV